MTTTADAPGDGAAVPQSDDVASVGRGGAVNLVGAVVYGAANFLLLVVLTRKYGVAAAGVVLISIGIFNICLNIAQLGCATGLVRTMARHRALNRHDLMRATLIIGLLPVFVIGMFLAALMWIGAPVLGRPVQRSQAGGQRHRDHPRDGPVPAARRGLQRRRPGDPRLRHDAPADGDREGHPWRSPSP